MEFLNPKFNTYSGLQEELETSCSTRGLIPFHIATSATVIAVKALFVFSILHVFHFDLMSGTPLI